MKKYTWYRILQVLSVIAYIVVVILSWSIFESLLNERALISATVKCPDGTKWDAYPITGNIPCVSLGSQYYELIDKKFAWSWNVVVYPLIVLVIGWSLVDLVKIAIVYIISGKKRVQESWFLRLTLFRSQPEEQTSEWTTS